MTAAISWLLMSLKDFRELLDGGLLIMVLEILGPWEDTIHAICPEPRIRVMSAVMV